MAAPRYSGCTLYTVHKAGQAMLLCSTVIYNRDQHLFMLLQQASQILQRLYLHAHTG